MSGGCLVSVWRGSVKGLGRVFQGSVKGLSRDLGVSRGSGEGLARVTVTHDPLYDLHIIFFTKFKK